MNKLEQLIQELCPHGVEYKKLGEVAEISRGASPRPIHSYLTNDVNGVNWIKIGDVGASSKYIVATEEKITEEGAKKSKKIKPGDFILSNSMSFGRPYISKIYGCIHDGWLSITNFEQYFISDFLYYLICSQFVQNQMKMKVSAGTIQNLNAERVKSLDIPIPPLVIQKEIVRILDTFTELEKELEKELEARKKQYEFYREQLLSFDENVPLVSLSEIALDMYRGAGIKRDEVRENGTPCVRYGEIYTDYNIWFDKCLSYTDENLIQCKKYVEKNDILFAITGEKVEEISKSCAYIGEEKCLAGGDIVVMKHKQNAKYLSYALSTFSACKQKSSGKVKSKVVHSSIPELKKIKIPLPPLEEQERIVNILDRFDALCNDLTCGLPAEIEARKKQYAYYRDKLLTFKNIAENS